MKKSLGQHFLKDKKILKKIADAAQIEKRDTVLEVGPGEGTLTELLLERAKKVIAIEKDGRLADFLREKFKVPIAENRLQIIEGDALKTNIYNLVTNDYILVGNIPYYITGALFKKVLESRNPPKSLTFVVQKEVAERVVAKNDKESILSISVKAFGKPEINGVIKAGSFSPPPKVHSAILSVRNISNRTTPTSEKNFFKILKAGFSHKRKLLIRNLANSLDIDTEKLMQIFHKIGIPEKSRAEDLNIENWFDLSAIIGK